MNAVAFTHKATDSIRITGALENLVRNGNHFIPAGQMQKFRTLILFSAFCDKSFFFKALRGILIDELSLKYPLALSIDDVESFDIEMIMNSFSRLVKQLKALHVEFIYQTLPSRKELFKSKMAEYI